MKLKSVNWLYIIGLIPFIIIVAVLSLILAKDNIWIMGIIAVLAIYIIYALLRKFIFMPRPKKEYSNLKAVSLNLPIDYQVDLYTCEALSNFDFMFRTVEVLSPLYFKKNEKAKVVINHKLLEAEGEQFMKIAIVREIEKYKTKSQVKILLRLATPLLIATAIILSLFVFKVDLLQYASGFTVNFVMPFVALVIFLSHLFFWNLYISKQEAKLDKFLLSCFSIKDVEHYILRTEELASKTEKTKYKNFNEHYAKTRIEKLKNY